MLTDYDAKAVAEVMGIAFLQSSEGSPSPATKPAKAARSSKSPTGSPRADFVIDIGGTRVLVVEVKTKKPNDQFYHIKGFNNRRLDFKKEAVSVFSSVLIEKAVERGLPRNALRHVAECLAGGDKAKVSSLEWGVVPKTTLERREKQLSPQESERTERVARLFVHARRALGTEAEAREFMTAPHPQLDGRSPIDASKTDLGTRRTEQILNALEYGLAL
jgi:putative toxin-antitoxin system antitoxin component (TIGR02293 family)